MGDLVGSTFWSVARIIGGNFDLVRMTDMLSRYDNELGLKKFLARSEVSDDDPRRVDIESEDARAFSDTQLDT